MERRIKTSVVSGVLATIVMSVAMYIMSFLGLPEMSPPGMLAAMLGIPLFAAWIMHFIIGITFALGYTYVCKMLHAVKNKFVKGVVYGVLVFVVAQIMMGILGAFLPMPAMEGSMALVLVASLIGHIIFGIVVVQSAGTSFCAESSNQ